MGRIYSVVKQCVICAGTFTVPPCRASTASTCSMVCRGKLIAQRYEAIRLSQNCTVCGELFWFPKCQAGRRETCSTKCANESFRTREFAKGKESANWLTGSSRHSDGYVYVYVGEEHPYANRGPYILEHRLVMERHMREAVPGHHFLIEHGGVEYLKSGISVHHINEDKTDNHVANLMACTPIAHREIHKGNKPMQGETWPEVDDAKPYTLRIISRTCKTCRKRFKAKLSTVDRGGAKYCCRSCYEKSRQK